MGETPGSIPNPEAKAHSADGTATGRLWESRSPPDILCGLRPRTCVVRGLPFFCVPWFPVFVRGCRVGAAFGRGVLVRGAFSCRCRLDQCPPLSLAEAALAFSSYDGKSIRCVRGRLQHSSLE